MGLGAIDGVSGLDVPASPRASYGRMSEVSRGKDTTVGHWEIAGLISHAPIDVVENEIIPALNRVGEGYEEKRIYLPGLLMSAEAAKVSICIAI